MAKLDLEAFDPIMKDMYALPGTRLKQWVVDARRESKWERETCPVVDVPSHDDNTELGCRNVGITRWSFLDHDACHACNELMESTKDRPDISAWIVERDVRPKSTADRNQLSDEVEDDWSTMKLHPMFARKP